LLTVFLSFLDARVARDQPRMFQGRAQIRIVLEQRSGYPVTNCASLSRWTTARHVNDQIKLISSLRQLQWLTDDHAQCFVWKIAIKRFPVNLDFTGAGSQINSCSGCLSASSSVILNFGHSYLSS